LGESLNGSFSISQAFQEKSLFELSTENDPGGEVDFTPGIQCFKLRMSVIFDFVTRIENDGELFIFPVVLVYDPR
jgi:hypothetical protein